jgi:hypothetical protein
MSMVGFLMPIPDLSRGPLTAEELVARAAATVAGERCFLVGQGQNVEVRP